MKFQEKKRRQAPAVIIVSLIDILIVLLIFLMVTTSFKDVPALRLNLPQSQRAELKPGVTEQPPIVITITTGTPSLYLGPLPMTWDRLQSELAAKVRAQPAGAVIAIRADEKAPYGQVLKVSEYAAQLRVKEIKAYVRPAMTP